MEIENPNANKHPAEISDQLVLEAVERSGYPLQIIVADELRRRKFQVRQEWAFVDQDTEQTRAIDLLAQRDLYSFGEELRVRPSLALVVECKQSELPYVFFLTGTKARSGDFPHFAGLRKYEVAVTSDDTRDLYSFGIPSLLDLWLEEFVQDVGEL
jgi:hypothetical protein